MNKKLIHNNFEYNKIFNNLEDLKSEITQIKK